MTPRPPGPRGLPIIGSLYDRLKDPLGFFTHVADEYGPISYIQMAHLNVFFITDPELVKEVLKDPTTYVKGRSYDGVRKFLGNAVFTANGDSWAQQKKMLLPLFQRQSLNFFVPILKDCVQERLQLWTKYSGHIVDAHQEMSSLAIEMISRSLFGSSVNEATKHALSRLVLDLTRISSQYTLSPIKLPSWLPTPLNQAIRQNQQKLDEIILNILKQRMRDRSPRHDLISLMMGAEGAENLLPKTLLRDEIVTLFLAGHETTASTLTWCFWHLALNPHLQDQCFHEAMDLCGRDDVESLMNHKIIKSVINESLRLYPPAWIIPRQTTVETTLSGYHIPKNYFVAICPYVQHRIEKWWPEPNRFKHERFLDAPMRDRSIYLPFSSGPRSCMGELFATLEMILSLSSVVKKYKLAPLNIGPQSLEPVLTLRPKGDFRVRLQARLDV